MDYAKIKLLNDDSGVELICKDVTNIFTKIADDVSNTVGVHKYKDLLTGTIIHTFCYDEDSRGRLVGKWQKFISKKEALEIIKSMSYEDKTAYITAISNALGHQVKHRGIK